MSTIFVDAPGVPRLRLNPTQSRLFGDELRRVQKLPASKGVIRDSGPDCKLTIKSGNRKKTYELYSRSVLHDQKTRKTWQFYFGLLLLEWLYP
jgi:hypothetical protein